MHFHFENIYAAYEYFIIFVNDFGLILCQLIFRLYFFNFFIVEPLLDY